MMRRLTKVEAAGNDFLFYDAADGLLSSGEVMSACDRHFGLGADGVVAMETVEKDRSRWHFFNCDGSRAAMCGNAARAAAAWLKANGRAVPHRLETEFGLVHLDFDLSTKQYRARVPYTGRKLEAKDIGGATLIDTGVPHAVVEWPTSVLAAEKDVMLTTVLKYRWPAASGSGGSNVTFFSRAGGGTARVEARTFERGVEDFTLSCGTGVLAAAVVACGALSVATPANFPADGVEVQNPGALLRVESADFPKSLTLVGPARVVFCAEWELR